MQGKRTVPGLGSLETVIMEALWKTQEASVRDVLEAIGNGYAYTTVMTVMQRLQEKGVLRRRLVDGAYLYQAVAARDQYAKETVQKMLDQLVDGFGDVALAQFLDTLDEVSPERLQRLRTKLQQEKRRK
ncbi:MAG: BlaI/MecI/CopY family transcriptional regulator [Patescibacteria group bacterium]